jgi:hypothetical protein
MAQALDALAELCYKERNARENKGEQFRHV